MAQYDFDLLVRAGRLFCADTGLDGPGAVAVNGDRIVAAGPGVAGAAMKVLDFADCTLLPGLVDLYAHPAHGGSKYGVDPDVEFLSRGVTTVMSQGDAGADNWQEYQRRSIGSFKVRIRMALNLARSGETTDRGSLADLDAVDVDACAGAIEAHPEGIWGITLNTDPVGPAATMTRMSSSHAVSRLQNGPGYHSTTCRGLFQNTSPLVCR